MLIQQQPTTHVSPERGRSLIELYPVSKPHISDKLAIGDIEGSSASSLGRHRRIEGRDYMTLNDIDGAKSRFLVKQELRNKRLGSSADKDFEGSPRSLHVKDINKMDSRNKYLYKRQVDPLNPLYVLPSVNLHTNRVIGPIEGQRSRNYLRPRFVSQLNTTRDIEGAQPRWLGSGPKHLWENDAELRKSYLNRNEAHNGDYHCQLK